MIEFKFEFRVLSFFLTMSVVLVLELHQLVIQVDE